MSEIAEQLKELDSIFGTNFAKEMQDFIDAPDEVKGDLLLSMLAENKDTLMEISERTIPIYTLRELNLMMACIHFVLGRICEKEKNKPKANVQNN